MEREYFVLSANHTRRHSPYIPLWGENDCGYRGRIEKAGRYTESSIRNHLGYYNSGVTTIAVPCEIVEALGVPVQEKFFDTPGGHWLKNNRETWRVLLNSVIEKPQYTPKPEYPGARRQKDS